MSFHANVNLARTTFYFLPDFCHIFESLLHALGQSLNDRRGDRARYLPLIKRFDNYRLSGLSHSDFQHITFLQFPKYRLIRGIKSSELRKRGAIIFGLSIPATIT